MFMLTGDFTGSRDGGDSYFPCIGIPNSPHWGTMTVGPGGEVYVTGEVSSITSEIRVVTRDMEG